MPPLFAISLYLVLVAALYAIQGILVQSVVAAVLCCLLIILLPARKARAGLVPISLFLLFTFSANLFSSSGRILYSYGAMTITDEGLHLAGVRTLRLLSMISGAKLLTGLIPLEDLVRCLERLFAPLERIRVPVHDFFSVMALTVKAFPVLTDYLLTAYRQDVNSREIRGLRDRLGHLITFLMPVFVRTIQSPETFFTSPDRLPKDTKGHGRDNRSVD